jgi:hypothetical protein
VYVGWFSEPNNEPPGTEFPALRNLIEGNQFIRMGLSRYGHGGMAYEETAVGTIFRRNVIRNTDYTGLLVTVFGEYALVDYDNHWYHNTVVNNGLAHFGEVGTGAELTNWGLGLEFHDNVLKNNILYGNLPGRRDTAFQLSLSVSGEQNNPPLGGFIIAGNLIASLRPAECEQNLQAAGNGLGDCSIYIEGVQNGSPDWFSARIPDAMHHNIEGDPLFTLYDPSADRFDLTLQPGSPAIDAGVPLTRTAQAGAGTVIPVQDAGYFHDGYQGMIAPDTIQVGDQRVAVVTIDYEADLITVDRSITWDQHAPVNLPYHGSAPDMGAYEAASAP